MFASGLAEAPVKQVRDFHLRAFNWMAKVEVADVVWVQREPSGGIQQDELLADWDLGGSRLSGRPAQAAQMETRLQTKLAEGLKNSEQPRQQVQGRRCGRDRSSSWCRVCGDELMTTEWASVQRQSRCGWWWRAGQGGLAERKTKADWQTKAQGQTENKYALQRWLSGARRHSYSASLSMSLTPHHFDVFTFLSST